MACDIQVACERAAVKARRDLQRGFTGLRTVAATACLVGMLGCVSGVMSSTPGFAAQLQLWAAVADRLDVQMRIATLDLVQWAHAIEATVPGPPPPAPMP